MAILLRNPSGVSLSTADMVLTNLGPSTQQEVSYLPLSLFSVSFIINCEVRFNQTKINCSHLARDKVLIR